MADVIMARRRHRRLRRQRIIVERPTLNEEYNDVDFFKRYRFRQRTVQMLATLMAPMLCVPDIRGNSPLSPFLQVCITMRYLAGAGFQQLIGDSINVSQSSVSRSIWRVIDILASPLFTRRFITFPTADEQLQSVKQGFHSIAGFPNVIGCVDGTFIPIMKPSEDTHEFINRKGSSSLNVQMICDHRFMITDCVVRWPGSTHDSRVFRNSRIAQQFENGTHGGILLGDSAYPCKTYLLTPYINPEEDYQKNYNSAHMKTRVKIEQTFGILKRRFGILKSPIQASPTKACKMTTSCTVLHNIGIECNDIIPADPAQALFNAADHEDDAVFAAIGGGQEVRRHIARTFFNN